MGMKRWTDKQDEFLIYWGACVGHAHVARWDLGRSENAGRRRIALLRKTKQDLVRRLEDEVRSADE